MASRVVPETPLWSSASTMVLTCSSARHALHTCAASLGLAAWGAGACLAHASPKQRRRR